MSLIKKCTTDGFNQLNDKQVNFGKQIEPHLSRLNELYNRIKTKGIDHFRDIESLADKIRQLAGAGDMAGYIRF